MKLSNKWQLLKSEKIFTSNILTLFNDTLKTPLNAQIKWEYVKRKQSGVIIIPYFSSTNSFILVKQYRPPIKKSIWQFPAGGKPKNKTFYQTAKTELLEETGYSCQKLISLGKVYPDPGTTANSGKVYLSLNPIFKQNPKTDPQEIITAKKFTHQQFLSLIKKGHIRDNWTLSAYLLFLLKFNKNKL